MECPYCNTLNRDDQEVCYHCGKDVSILRLIVNKAKHHYNLGIEHAERDRLHEAKTELQNAIDLNRSHVKSWLALGTVYQRLGDFQNAQTCWKTALELDPDYAKIHDYLGKSATIRRAIPMVKRLRLAAMAMTGLIVILAMGAVYSWATGRSERVWRRQLMTANEAFLAQNYKEAIDSSEAILNQSPPSHIASAALIIRNSSHRQIQFFLDQIERLNSQQRYGEALEQIERVRRLTPGEEVMLRMEYLQTQVIRPQLAAQVEERLHRPVLDWRAVVEADKIITDYARYFPNDEAVTVWMVELSDRAALLLTEQINHMTDEFKSTLDFKTLIFQLSALEKVVARTEAFKEAYSPLAEAARQNAIQAAFEAVAGHTLNGQFEEAEHLLETLSADRTFLELVDAPELSALRQKLDQQKKTALFDLMNTAIKRMDWEAFDSANRLMQAASLDAVEQLQWTNIQQRAIQIKGDAYLQWFASRLLMLQSGRINAADAQLAIDRWEFLQAHPGTLNGRWASFQDDLMFCAAQAYLILGHHQKSQELRDTLATQFPNSPYAAPLAARQAS